MQNGLEIFLRRGIRERELAHALAVERTVFEQIFGAELHAYGARAGLSRRRQLMGDLVGVDNGGTQLLEYGSDAAFAAADSAGKSDDGRHQAIASAGNI